MFTHQRSRISTGSIITVLLTTFAMLSVALGATASSPVEPADPDRPPFAFAGSEADYVRLRAEHIAELRGLPYADPGARVRAIEQISQAERALTRAAAPASLTVWTPIGPAPVPNGQTYSTTMPVSGRVSAIAVHPTNPNTVYVGTAQGGLYRSLDGGAHWTPLLDSAQSLAIGAVTVDPVTPSTVFVGTGEGNLSGDSFFGVGLYRITNADTNPVIAGPFETRIAGTGTPVSNGHAFIGTAINKIVVDLANDNRIFVGNTSGVSGLSGDGICCGGTAPPSGSIGLYFSSNALATTPTFSRVGGLLGNGLAGVTDIVFEPGSSDNMIVGSKDLRGGGTSGVYRSTNASTASAATSPTFSQVVALGVVNSKLAINKVSSTVTVLAATGTSNGTLLKSTDGGATFPTTLSAAAGFCSPQCFYDIAVALDPGSANNIWLGGAAGSNILRKSTDGGTTFPPSQVGLHGDVHAISVAPSNAAVLYHGNDGGIWQSTNSGTTWVSRNNSDFSATQFQSLALHPLDRNFTIGGTQDNGTECLGPCNQAAPSWIRADFGDGGYSLIDQNATDTTNVTMYHTYFNQSNNLIGFGRNKTTACATETQWSFKGRYGGIVDPTVHCDGSTDTFNGINIADPVLFYAPMALGPGNPNTVYFGTDTLYRSANRGDTMTAVSQALVARVSAIGISPQNDNVRIVGLTDGEVWATTTGSSTLVEVDTLAMPIAYVARAVIDPTNANTAYVTFDRYGLAAGQHVWKTTNLNAGTPAWTAKGGTGGNVIPDVPTNAFVVDPLHPNTLFAGTDIGVYRSTDGGTNWMPFGTGLPRMAVFDMAIQNKHRILRIATHGKGMYEIPLDLAELLYLPLIKR